MQQQQQLKIDINKSTLLKCECGNPYYKQVIIMRQVSGILMGQAGKDIISPIQIMICTECKKPHENYAPYLKESEVKEEPLLKLASNG